MPASLHGVRVPPSAACTPSNNSDSTRTWSANHSMWRRRGRGRGHGQVQRRRAVSRHLEVVRRGNGGNLQPVGDSPTPGDVDLQAVDGLGLAHPLEREEVIAVLARSHICGHMVRVARGVSLSRYRSVQPLLSIADPVAHVVPHGFLVPPTFAFVHETSAIGSLDGAGRRTAKALALEAGLIGLSVSEMGRTTNG